MLMLGLMFVHHSKEIPPLSMAVVDVNWVLGTVSSDRRDVKRKRESTLMAVYMILLSLFWLLCVAIKV